VPSNCKKKILIVGCGLAGSTMARILAENNFKVKLIDKRNHIGGNIFDFINKNNERIHKYGPHLLHCNKKSPALKFLSRFTEWINYEHKVRALLANGKTTPLPINQITLEDIYQKKFNSESEVRNFLDTIRNKNLDPKNTDQLFESTVGNKLSDIFFRPYTKKMWGIDPKNLSINIGARLPVRTNKDTRYFYDNFQALPKNGYTKMIENMLSHENIKVFLNQNFNKKMEEGFDHIFLCLPIDKYFNYIYGVLPYRSIIFEERCDDFKNLSAPVINFTDNSKYTRKTQWSLFPNCPELSSSKKTITYEVPCSLDQNPDEYYYPVQTSDSKRIYESYKKLAKLNKKITFCGRAGLFRYIDMVPAVQIHLQIANSFINNLGK